MGLLYYGFSKIKDVASRDFFTQTKVNEMSPKQRFGNFPDVIFWRELSPCEEQDDLMTVITMGNAPINVTNFFYMRFIIAPRKETALGNYSTWYSGVFIVPSQANPYARIGGSLSSIVRRPSSLESNSYYPQQARSMVDIHVEPKATKVIHTGIWGLFGASEEELQYSVSSSSNTRASNENMSAIDVVLSSVSLNQTQILVTSIPSAFADWGGAFSAAWAIFYFCFGAPRLNPFGMISRLIRRKTQRSITKFYGYWSSDALSNHPQASLPINSIMKRTSISQRSSFHKTTQCMGDTSSKVSSSASLDKAVQGVVDVLDRGQQDENSIRAQAEHIHKVERLEVDLDKLQVDFNKLHGLLKEYYLEMDLTNTENLPLADD
ncbi:hypothetical protein BGZ83_002948, partial [Gryganskiella cystojenkinii]